MARTPGGKVKRKKREIPRLPNDGHKPPFGGPIKGRYGVGSKKKKKPSTARTRNDFYK